MESKEKLQFTLINKNIPFFNSSYTKLVTSRELDEKEKSFLLTIALLFFQEYEKDKRFSSYLDFGYFIILKYSLSYEDYRPLYDFAINFGFYPIVNDILQKGLVKDMKLIDELSSIQIDDFQHFNYIETFEQRKVRTSFLKQDASSISYIAPTSYGKSSLIIEHIKENEKVNYKVGIIVPTKSLLTQTYKEIRKAKLNRKLITHDEMYNDEFNFIGVLTQERALRLLENNEIAFDILYIDEAHNIFDKDSRSILLSRLIRYNSKRNKNQKLIYLSPLISDSNNLKTNQNQKIIEQKIKYNMKVPEIFEVRENDIVYIYNRFTNKFYEYKEIAKDNLPTYIKYIKEEKGNKNFIYHRTPKKIEEFANEIYEHSELIIQNSNVKQLINEIKQFVHEEFYMVKLLEKGIIYLHGKMPELIKEYLEYQFKVLPELNIVIANKVILEGINLPIDKLFILHSNFLKEKEVTNLIGRVNRLNEIFINETNQLTRLLPPVHFINSKYNKKSIKMENLIVKLRSNIFKDEIKNPTLIEFDMKEKINEKNQEKLKEIMKNEEMILEENLNEEEIFKRTLLKSGLQEMILLNKEYLEIINKRRAAYINSSKWVEMDIIDKVYSFFIEGFNKDIIFDYEINRLNNKAARNFYRQHIFYKQTKSLKENVSSTYKYFLSRIASGDDDIFIGPSYGEKAIATPYYQESFLTYYVDLSTKNKTELINLAIIKIKLEDDFVGYKLNKFVVILYDLSLITDVEYNQFVYGTTNQMKIDLIKTGLSLGLISRLEKDGQLVNMKFDENNNIFTNQEFLTYKAGLNGFYKFEIEKYL